MNWLERLVCPRDHSALRLEDSFLVCARGHRYPVVDGIPVMLVDDVEQTIGIARASIEAAREIASGTPAKDLWFLSTLGINDVEKEAIVELAKTSPRLDPVVQFMVGATNGILYRDLIGKLTAYTIPELRMGPGDGKTLIDIGCNWGRWSLAAAGRGYQVVGIDPSLGAVLAGRRVSRQMGFEISFVVADARFLPFPADSFDCAFSYSVLQHLSKDNAKQSLAQIGRVLKPRGTSLVQMPNRFGLRCLYHQARRRFRPPQGFEVRYWSPRELRSAFSSAIGPTRLSVDCFFGIGLQAADAPLMSRPRRAAIRASEFLRGVSERIPSLGYVADSVYANSVKESDSGG